MLYAPFSCLGHSRDALDRSECFSKAPRLGILHDNATVKVSMELAIICICLYALADVRVGNANPEQVLDFCPRQIQAVIGSDHSESRDACP